MLPDVNSDCESHSLVSHKGDHPAYTTMVMDKLKEVADTLAQLADEGMYHDEVKVNLLEESKRIEEDLWKLIVRISRASIKKVFANKSVNNSILKMKSGDTALRLPNLA